MAHFAKVVNGEVVQVIAADQEFIDNYVDTSPGKWIQTSYNTRYGVHTQGGTPLRKNYAQVGGTYDATRDAFIPKKQYDSWVLNEDTCVYDPPVAYPSDGKNYEWDETITNWVEETT